MTRKRNQVNRPYQFVVTILNSTVFYENLVGDTFAGAYHEKIGFFPQFSFDASYCLKIKIYTRP